MFKNVLGRKYEALLVNEKVQKKALMAFLFESLVVWCITLHTYHSQNKQF